MKTPGYGSGSRAAPVLRRRPAAGRRGAVILLVLWAMVILALLAGGISFTIKQDLAVSGIQQDRLSAHWAARAGVERGIAELMDDANAIDSHQDYWANFEKGFKDIGVAGGSFSLLRDGYEPQPQDWPGINDECAKLNLNTATREQLLRLPRMTPPIASAILDWRDQDENIEENGIERGHYESLPHPYMIRNGRFRTTRELLLVRGVTPELFYGEDANADGRLDANENDGLASAPPDNGDGLLDRGWYAWVTVFSFDENVDSLGQPRTNIASADAATLASKLKLEEWAAQSIVKYRGQNAFKHLSDLLQVTRDPEIERGSPDSDINSRSDDERDRPVTKGMFRRIADGISLTDDKILPGRVNINTAPRAVLAALTSDDTANAIIRERDAAGAFTSIADLLEVGGLNAEKFAEIDTLITVHSSVFRIHSVGTSNSGLAMVRIECVVDRSEKVPKVLYWLESSP